MFRSRWLVVMMTVLAGFVTCGCEEVTVGARSDDFKVQYSWTAASMPPPYHFEYDVTIGPGLAGSVVYLPDYPGADTPTWSAEFTFTETDLDTLYQLIVRQGGSATSGVRSGIRRSVAIPAGYMCMRTGKPRACTA